MAAMTPKQVDTIQSLMASRFDTFEDAKRAVMLNVIGTGVAAQVSKATTVPELFAFHNTEKWGHAAINFLMATPDPANPWCRKCDASKSGTSADNIDVEGGVLYCIRCGSAIGFQTRKSVL